VKALTQVTLVGLFLLLTAGIAVGQDAVALADGVDGVIVDVEATAGDVVVDEVNLLDFTTWHPVMLWWIAPIGSILALIFAFVFYRQVRAANPGDEKMQEIAEHVRQGAYAYLKRQYKVVTIFFIAVAALLFVMGLMGVQHKIVFVAFLTGGFFSGLCGFFGMKTATLASSRTAQGAKEGLNRGLIVAFRAGAVMGMVVVGFGLLDITMWFLILTKVAPAIANMMGVEFHMNLVEVTVVMLTFGMGASSQALFARVGGGIFTKAADVGADLVGKVEAGIPEDDPRNPATIADNVGDNVGDVAGMGADLYESYCGSILATAALGVAAAIYMGLGQSGQISLIATPMVLAGVGILLSIIGIYVVRTKDGATMKQLMGALNGGVFLASGLIVVAGFGVCYFLLNTPELAAAGVRWLGVWGSIVTGLVAGIIIGHATERYTSYDYQPTKNVAAAAETGPGTVIISGLAEGMKSTWMSLLTVMVAIIAAYSFAGGFSNMPMGLYGVGIAAVGMLATLGITLATDAYGPIADNAGGNAEMTGQEAYVRERTDALDSLGNTTAAMGKGFAIGSAALTALALLAAYVEEVRIGQVREGREAVVAVFDTAEEVEDAGLEKLVHVGHGKFAAKTELGTDEDSFQTYMALDDVPDDLAAGDVSAMLVGGMVGDMGDHCTVTVRTDLDGDGEIEIGETQAIALAASSRAQMGDFMDHYGVNLMNPKVLCGMFSGVLLVFLFSAMTMKAVGRAAQDMVNEVRRQFREIPGIMEGTGQPDYARCVDISTAGAQKEMIVPALLALIVPVLVGLIFGVAGVMGLLAGGLTCGFAMAVFMANAGGAWDNAKKYIETGAHGGKGSEAHKAAVTGDTVGDPFKDTSGPSLNILIKLMSMVSVVFAGLVVKFSPIIGDWLGMN
jgi:K(+)-stimulated pyrophosphate-energized sodium pump